MIQKKICMVGISGTGKTSLVQQFIYSKFSEKYHSTVGVKIDRKAVQIAGTQVTLLLWDLAGEDAFQSVQASYLRGSSGIVFVVDGTRRETVTGLAGLQLLVGDTLGTVPAVIAVNKADLADQWQLAPPDIDGLSGDRRLVLETSAKTGRGVDDAFHWLAGQVLRL
jgi:small GTP-binding protein